MFFSFQSSLVLAYLSLAAGTALIVWAMQNKKAGHFLAKSVGIIIFFLSLLSMLYTAFYGAKYWIAGKAPRGMPVDVTVIENMKIDEGSGTPQ